MSDIVLVICILVVGALAWARVCYNDLDTARPGVAEDETAASGGRFSLALQRPSSRSRLPIDVAGDAP